MIEQEIRKRESTGIDVLGLMEFQKQFSEFNELISKAHSYYHEFWTQLAQDKPSIPTIKFVGNGITKMNDSLKETFERIMEKNSTQVKLIILYGNYLKLVVNDNEESEKTITKANNLLSSSSSTRGYLEDNRIKYNDTTNMSIVISSGDQKTLGLIKGINSETIRLFEYTSEELKNCTVNLLMPKIFSDHHSKYDIIKIF